MTKSEYALEITDLHKTYYDKSGAKEALKGVSLNIPRGSFFALLGPNGAGKSTLINIVSSLVTKSSGKVAICGYDLDEEMRSARMALGVVPQELIIDSFFNVYETLDIYAGYYGVPKSKRRTMEIIEALGLADKANTNSRKLSGGMRRRLLVAKALVHNPDLVILDEPTAGVDVELRKQLWEYIQHLNDNGTTIMLTTHYLEEAEQLCDRIAVINHGHLIANEPKAGLMSKIDEKCLLVSMKDALVDIPIGLNEFCRQAGANITLGDDDERQIRIRFSPRQVSTGEVISKIQENDISIHDIQTREPDLEEVFTHLINED